MALRLFTMIFALALLPLAIRAETTKIGFGDIDLPAGVVHQNVHGGIDSVFGELVSAKEGVVVSYDIGGHFGPLTPKGAPRVISFKKRKLPDGHAIWVLVSRVGKKRHVRMQFRYADIPDTGESGGDFYATVDTPKQARFAEDLVALYRPRQ